MNSRHPGPRRAWKGGSESRLLTPDPVDPSDSAGSASVSQSGRSPRRNTTFLKKSRLVETKALGEPWEALGELWGSFGRVWGSFGSLFLVRNSASSKFRAHFL